MSARDRPVARAEPRPLALGSRPTSSRIYIMYPLLAAGQAELPRSVALMGALAVLFSGTSGRGRDVH